MRELLPPLMKRPKKTSFAYLTRTMTAARVLMINNSNTNSRRVLYIDEPQLQFAEGQSANDPHDGLSLFGPFSKGLPDHPKTPSYMVIGAPEGILAMQAWSNVMNRPCATTDIRKHQLWPPFPGYDVAFGSEWSE